MPLSWRAGQATNVYYRCLRNKRPSKPYEFMGFVAMDVTNHMNFYCLVTSLAPNPDFLASPGRVCC